MKEYVSTRCLGDVTPHSAPGVVAAFYGPRGGTKAIVELSPNEALELGKALIAAAIKAGD